MAAEIRYCKALERRFGSPSAVVDSLRSVKALEEDGDQANAQTIVTRWRLANSAARQVGLLVGEQPIGFLLRPKPSQAEAVSEPAKPVQEEPKVVQLPAIPSGIQTPRGPLLQSQQELFKPQGGQSQKRGIGL